MAKAKKQKRTCRHSATGEASEESRRKDHGPAICCLGDLKDGAVFTHYIEGRPERELVLFQLSDKHGDGNWAVYEMTTLSPVERIGTYKSERKNRTSEFKPDTLVWVHRQKR